MGQGTLRHLPTAEKRKLQAKQGRPLPLVEMKIVDDAGLELPWDGKTFGALLVRGPYVVDRYYKVIHRLVVVQPGMPTEARPLVHSDAPLL